MDNVHDKAAPTDSLDKFAKISNKHQSVIHDYLQKNVSPSNSPEPAEKNLLLE